MSPTLHRPSAPGGDTHHRFDFLHGIDLEREHVRHAPSRTPWIVGAFVLLLVVATIGILVVAAPQPTPDPVMEPTAMSLHDSGIAQALQAQELAREARIAQAHDAGISLAVRARTAELNRMHDSGIAQALQARQAELDAREAMIAGAHDSGIAYRLRNP